MPQLFELRARWKVWYDCPDNGWTDICDCYESVALSQDRSKLDEMAAELTSGYKGEYWTLERSQELRKLHPGYDNMRDTKYEVVDVSDLVI